MDRLEFNEQRVVRDPAVALQGQGNGTFLATPVFGDGTKGAPTVLTSAEGHSIKNIIQPGVQNWILTRIDPESQEYQRQQYEQRERQSSRG